MVLRKPVILLVFANDRDDRERYLRNLPAELRGVRQELDAGGAAGLWEVIERTNATIDDILDVFQHPDYRDRIAIFHFGGHAGSYELLLESAGGTPARADAAGLAAFLGQQRGLELVFLNGCSTGAQASGLLEANVAAVIATSRSIDDQVATTFATRFYRGLASGAGVRVSFDEAAAAIRTERGGRARDVLREDVDDDRWPWELAIRDGAQEAIANWSLGEAAGDPLFGLPQVPPADLPDSPYRNLQWFGRDHAEVFFGRGQEIRELYERVTSAEAAPVILLYGQAGVGKSSLLEAGLLPRLEASHETRYVRRESGRGLLGTLQHVCGADETGKPIAEVWLDIERVGGKPLVVIVDQAEEVFTRPNRTRPNELAEFTEGLQEVFRDPGRRPRGKLILGFRKEWLAETEAELAERTVPRSKVFLGRLGRSGIIEAVSGPARVPRLRDHYGLTIEEGLPAIIADDLLEDPKSPVAPTLQILLTKLWSDAVGREASRPSFELESYQTFKRKGILLKDFLDQQLAELRQRWDMTNAMADLGLSLDILDYHTTPLGTAERRSADELTQAYGHIGELMARSLAEHGYPLPAGSHSGMVHSLIQTFMDLFLLVDDAGDGGGGTPGTRLAHDTLAPLVRWEFDRSAKPGQLARRILESRAIEWGDGATGPPLDERDLALVEDGAPGMRAWATDEARLIEASRKQRGERRRRRRQTWAAIGILGLLAVGLGGLAWKAFGRASSAKKISDSRALASKAEHERDQTQALILAIEAANRAWTEEAEAVLRRLVDTPRVDVLLHSVYASTLGPNGQWILTHDDSTVRFFDVDSNMERWKSHLPVGEVRNISADGRRAIVVNDTLAEVWDLAMGRRLQRLPLHGGILSPDGQWIFGQMPSGAELWNAETGDKHHTLSGTTRNLRFATFSQDGRRLLALDGDEVAVWEVPSGRKLVTLRLPRNPGIPRRIRTRPILSPHGRWLITRSSADTAWLWDSTGHQVATLPVGRSTGFTFSPDEQSVLTLGGDTSKLLDIPSGKEHRSLAGRLGRNAHAAFSPDGSQIVTGGSDGSVKIWEVKTGGELISLWGGIGIVRVAFDMDDRHVVATYQDGVLRRWEFEMPDSTLDQLYEHTIPFEGVAYSPGGHWLLTTHDTTAQLWHSAGRRANLLRGYPGGTGSGTRPADFSSNERWLLTINDSEAQVWEVSTGNLKQTLRDPEAVRGAWFSPVDTDWVITVGASVRLWEVESGKEVAVFGQDESVVDAAFSLDGKTVVTVGDTTVQLWSTAGCGHPAACRPIKRSYGHASLVRTPVGSAQILLMGEHGKAQLIDASTGALTYLPGALDSSAAALSPGGGRLVIRNSGGALTLMDLPNGRPDTLTANARDLLVSSFSFDGNKVVTLGSDGTSRIWDVLGHLEEAVIQDDRCSGGDVMLSPDNRTLAVMCDDGTARIHLTDSLDLKKLAESRLPANLKPDERKRVLREHRR